MSWPVTLPFWLSVISPCFSEDVNCKFWSPAVVTVWDFPLFFPSSLYSLPIISFSCMKKFYWLWLYAKYLSINSLQRLSPVSCQCLQLCLPWDTLAWAVSVPQLCPQPFKTFRTDKLQHKVQSKECSDTKNVKDQAENLLSNILAQCWRTSLSKVETRGNQQLNFWKKVTSYVTLAQLSVKHPAPRTKLLEFLSHGLH